MYDLASVNLISSAKVRKKWSSNDDCVRLITIKNCTGNQCLASWLALSLYKHRIASWLWYGITPPIGRSVDTCHSKKELKLDPQTSVKKMGNSSSVGLCGTSPKRDSDEDSFQMDLRIRELEERAENFETLLRDAEGQVTHLQKEIEARDKRIESLVREVDKLKVSFAIFKAWYLYEIINNSNNDCVINFFKICFFNFFKDKISLLLKYRNNWMTSEYMDKFTWK